MDSQYKLLSELLSDQAAFITSPKTSLANYWGGHCPPAPPVSTGLGLIRQFYANVCLLQILLACRAKPSTFVVIETSDNLKANVGRKLYYFWISATVKAFYVPSSKYLTTPVREK